MTHWLEETFGARPAVIGVLHLPPLPGSPRAADGSFETVWEHVRGEAAIYAEEGIHGFILENHGDAPFPKDRNEPHVGAAIAVMASRLKERHGLPVGINLLRNDAIGALAAAAASGADFIRVNVLTGVTATDQGLIEGVASELMRYRSRIGSSVRVLADVNVKFGTPLYTPDLATLAKATAGRGLADGLIVTGSATGALTDSCDVVIVQNAVDVPVLVGSGVTSDNIEDFKMACGLIVGSSLKVDGYVENPVARSRVADFMALMRV